MLLLERPQQTDCSRCWRRSELPLPTPLRHCRGTEAVIRGLIGPSVLGPFGEDAGRRKRTEHESVARENVARALSRHVVESVASCQGMIEVPIELRHRIFDWL